MFQAVDDLKIIKRLKIIRTAKFGGKMLQITKNLALGFPVRNTNIYKIRELCRAVFSAIYNISPLNFAILLILRCVF